VKNRESSWHHPTKVCHVLPHHNYVCMTLRNPASVNFWFQAPAFQEFDFQVQCCLISFLIQLTWMVQLNPMKKQWSLDIKWHVARFRELSHIYTVQQCVSPFAAHKGTIVIGMNCDNNTGKVRRTGLGFEFSGVPNPNVLGLGFTSHVYLALALPLSFLSFLSSLTLSASLATVPQLGTACSFIF
jgi:hypothetical protein